MMRQSNKSRKIGSARLVRSGERVWSSAISTHLKGPGNLSLTWTHAKLLRQFRDEVHRKGLYNKVSATSPRLKLPGELDHLQCIPGAYLSKKTCIPSNKAFMGDATPVTNRKQVLQKSLDKFNDLLRWCLSSRKY